MKLREVKYKVQDICMQIQYSNCRNMHDTGSFIVIVWDEHSMCTRSKETMKGTRMEHRRPRIHDTGVTTRLGTDG